MSLPLCAIGLSPIEIEETSCTPVLFSRVMIAPVLTVMELAS